jgi:hypothetical protein
VKNGGKKAKRALRITTKDYLKAVKRADRENELAQQVGWRSVHKIHKSKKTYDRKALKKRLDEHD